MNPKHNALNKMKKGMKVFDIHTGKHQISSLTKEQHDKRKENRIRKDMKEM